jgi:hypothetical protein
MAEHSLSTPGFLMCACHVLEEYELDILFSPMFTPTLDERAELSDLFLDWRPDAGQLAQLVAELAAEVPYATVRLPDGTESPLTLHAVMVERYVRLLRLDQGPEPETATALRAALPEDLWPVAVALLYERGMTPRHQAWFAAFVTHVAALHPVSRESLETAADFVASQPTLDRSTVTAAAEALMRAAQGTAAYAAGGHAYWSPDVAQHHHYRGQGRVDVDRIDQHQAEVRQVTTLVEDLRTFEAAV